MSNPFDDNPPPSPFRDSPPQEPTVPEQEKIRTLEEAATLLSATKKLESQVKLASQTRNSVWLTRLQGVSVKLGRALAEFAQQAFVLAMVKFIWEFCAMILNGLADYLFSKSGQRMEFTTPGINCLGSKGPAPAQSPPPNYSEPFAQHYGRAW